MRTKSLHRYFAYAFLVIFTIEAVFIALSIFAMLRFARIESSKPEELGVTFSQVQAERFGSNWQENYTALLNDLHFKHLRIIAYWDRVEKTPGVYDFSELDWMVAEAKKYNAHVTIALGQRVLRYPECFYPAWLDKQDSSKVTASIDPYLRAVANRYRDNDTVAAWQLENEFLLHVFGECPDQNLTKQALNREVQVLKSADDSRPIVITASDEFGLPMSKIFGDIYGFSMYKTVWNQLTKNGYFTYRQPGLFNWWRASMISLFDRQDIRIHELQAEPWGPVGNETLSLAEASKSMNPQKLRANINYARSTKIRHIDLWGAEWWYWMKTTKHDNSMWETVRSLQ